MKLLDVVEAWDESKERTVQAMKKTPMSNTMRSNVSSMMMIRIARLRDRGSKRLRTRNDEGDMVQGVNGEPAKNE